MPRILIGILALLAGGGIGGVFALDIDIGKAIDIGRKAITGIAGIPQEREIEIGRGMAASLLGATPLVPDPEVQRYVNRVGRWLAGQTERRDLPWRFGVLDTDTVNAFAAPGGYIFVSKGLLRIANSESELAGVLAHEIGHVLEKHHLEAIRKQALTSAAGDLVTEAVAQNTGFNAAPFVQVGTQLWARGLDREDEFEADQIGVVVATRAGYEPYGLPRVLLSLNAINPGDRNLSLLNSTHPPTRDRLARLEQQMVGQFNRYEGQPQVTDRYLQVRQHVH
ncbi:MAG: M48 family metalloprotease [Chromatiales bacterium]